MKEYSPKRRTAVVFSGSGTTGAYHAGVLKALDESGVKIDLMVGTGAGAVAAAFAAVNGGAKLHGPGGFWRDVRRASFYRLRPVLRLALGLLGVSFAIFAAPMVLGLLFGVAVTLLLIVERVAPGSASRALSFLWVAPEALSGPYLAAQAIPVFALALLALAVGGGLWFRDRRRFAEGFESVLDARPGLRRLSQALGQVTGPTAGGQVQDDPLVLGRRYVAQLTESFGEPGCRELILRAADLDRGSALAFVLLREELSATRRVGPLAEAVDLRAPGQEGLLFDALATGVLCPMAMPFRRVAFPKGAPHAGEVHRLTDGTLAPGCGIAEAIAAGAEQVIVVCGVPQEPAPLARRRGPLARMDATVRALEAQAIREIEDTERFNRLVGTLGHRTDDGRGAWEDPATGRVTREIDLWVIRPARREVGPLEFDGARDPATEVLETAEDLLERGFVDACRQFVVPVVGQASLPEREEGKYRNTPQPVTL